MSGHDPLAEPLFLRVHEAVDAAFPKTLMRACGGLQKILGARPGNPRRRSRYPVILLKRLSTLKDDADFQQYLLWRAKLGEIPRMQVAAIWFCLVLTNLKTTNPWFDRLKQEIGPDVRVLQMTRIGLRWMDGDLHWREALAMYQGENETSG